jgi:hypothetical protein
MVVVPLLSRAIDPTQIPFTPSPIDKFYILNVARAFGLKRILTCKYYAWGITQ